MKISFKAFLLLSVIAFVLSCSKGASRGNTEEENLSIAINPDPGSTVVKSLGETYSFKVVVQSKMPAGGVDINVVYKKDADNTTLFSQTLTSSSAETNITINNIPLTSDVGTVTVKVTSKSKPTNTATKTFKLARK